jgi:hypothetical protein
VIDDLLDRDAPGERERITQGFRDLIARMQADIDAKRQAERVRHLELFKKMGDDQLARDHRPVCTRLGLPACRKPTCGVSYCSGVHLQGGHGDGLPDAFPWPDDGF